MSTLVINVLNIHTVEIWNKLFPLFIKCDFVVGELTCTTSLWICTVMKTNCFIITNMLYVKQSQLHLRGTFHTGPYRNASFSIFWGV